MLISGCSQGKIGKIILLIKRIWKYAEWFSQVCDISLPMEYLAITLDSSSKIQQREIQQN